MFDSGTTLTILPQKVFSSLRSYFMTYYSHLPSLSSQTNVLDRSVVLTSPPSSDWPTIAYYFDGFYVSVPPSVYFLEVKSKGKSYWMFGIRSMDISVGEEMGNEA